MKIGLAQYKFINNDISFNISQIEKAIINSSGRVDLLCFGETFLQGFDSLSWDYKKDKDIAVSQDSLEIQRICQLSKDYNIAIAFGYFELDAKNIYSSYAFISDGILIHNYRRVSKGWKEFTKTDHHYKEGETIELFSFKGHEFEIALCGDLFDLNFERFKTDAIVLWPVYVNYSLKQWIKEEKEYAIQAGKISNRVLMINSLSDDPISCGGAFYFKDGAIQSKLSYEAEDILIVEL